MVRLALYAVLGAASGAVAATCILYLRLSDLPHPSLPAEFYLYPGLIFGLIFGFILFWMDNTARPLGAAGFALAATVSNALAVTFWTTTNEPIASALGAVDSSDVMFSLMGAMAGAIGGGLLGYSSRWLLKVTAWPRLLATGAALGLFLPLVQSEAGFFAFFILWQAGYAATMATVVAPKRA